MKRLYLPALGLLLAASVAVATTSQRIRGTVSSITDDRLVLHLAQGPDQEISIGADTKYVRVARSDIDKIQPGSYIGTATKEVGSRLVALEVVVFPPAMRGTGEGHYDWDQITDTTIKGSVKTASSMTNGNVAAVKTKATVKSSMTNGNVATVASQNGERQLSVTYDGGQQTITLPPTAPIVTLLPGTKADVVPGASVFAVVSSGDSTPGAQFVAVGTDGVVPPM